ncbi:MAG: uroporphyrinogen decarboxylase family protein [Armatimonadota bacterium]
MTDRERILAVINHQPVDRVPIAPFIHANFVKAFYKSQDADVIQGTVDVYGEFGFDLIHRNCFVAYDEIGVPGESWEPQKESVLQNKGHQTTTTVHTPKGDLQEVYRLIQVSEYDFESAPVEYLIKSEKDFDLLMEFQPPVKELDLTPIIKAKEAIGDKGVVAPWIQGAFNFPTIHFRRLDDLVLDAMTNPEFFVRMMEYCLSRNMAIISQMISAGADILSYGGNIASGKMFGESFFTEYIFLYEKRLIDFIQSMGVHVLYHNCGYAKNLFPCYHDLGMHMYESLTAPPYGDTLLNDVFSVIGPEVVLCGGIDQIDFLRNASLVDIRSRVRDILEIGKSHDNFILSTSDYFHEDTDYSKIAVLSSASMEFGRY